MYFMNIIDVTYDKSTTKVHNNRHIRRHNKANQHSHVAIGFDIRCYGVDVVCAGDDILRYGVDVLKHWLFT
jgi:hypothetical protein